MSPQDPDPSDPFSSGGGGSAFDIAGFLRAALRVWWIPAIFLFLGIGVGLVLLRSTKPEFIATSEIKVERRASTSAISLSGTPLTVEGATAPEDLKTIEESLANLK